MKDFKTFFQELMAIDSPTGYAFGAIQFLKQEIESLGFPCYVSEKGNLIVTVEGKESGIVRGVCAHTDTLGLMVRGIQSDGTLSVTTLGSPQLPTLDGEYCKIYTRDHRQYTGTILSTSPSSHVYKDATTAPRDLEHLCIRIDEVVKNKDDVLKLGIQHGDIVAIDTKTCITESGFIKSRFLDDKLSVAILYEVLKELVKDRPQYKTYFMITTYEEVGHGNSYIPQDITELLGVDMGCIGTDLACTEFDVSICAKDSSGPYDYAMTTRLLNLAKENHLPHAIDIYPMYGSDVSAALRGGNNIKGALIGPGVHASHGMERSTLSAVDATKRLVLAYIR